MQHLVDRLLASSERRRSSPKPSNSTGRESVEGENKGRRRRYRLGESNEQSGPHLDIDILSRSDFVLVVNPDLNPVPVPVPEGAARFPCHSLSALATIFYLCALYLPRTVNSATASRQCSDRICTSIVARGVSFSFSFPSLDRRLQPSVAQRVCPVSVDFCPASYISFF